MMDQLVPQVCRRHSLNHFLCQAGNRFLPSEDDLTNVVEDSRS